jgi:hypothetical protein
MLIKSRDIKLDETTERIQGLEKNASGLNFNPNFIKFRVVESARYSTA